MAQHDYVIANGTGAAVRSDLNGSLAAIVSNNSGATEPGTMYAYQWWPDTTTGLLKIRNAANNAWVTVGTLASTNLGLLPLAGGTMTGALAVTAGTAALPGIAVSGDLNTGIFFSGADAIDFATGGTRRLGISSAGELTAYGGNLTLNAQGDLRFADSDSSNYVALQAPATVASNVTFTLPSADGTNGQVLATNGTGTLGFATAGGASNLADGTAATPSVNFSSDTDTGVFRAGANRLAFATNGASVGEFDGSDLKFNSGYGSVATAYGCRAWVNFNGTGTVAIRSSGNVSSITDNGVGDYTVNFTTAMPDANYSVVGTTGTGSGANKATFEAPTATPTTSAVRGVTSDFAGTITDYAYVSVAIFR